MGRNYRNIKAWILADRLVKEIYKVTKNFPSEERFGITSQLRRASVSVAVNIVEGSSRKHTKDYIHFLYIAKGSLSESEYLINLSHELAYIDGENHKKLYNLSQEAASTLYGLIKSIEKSL